MIFLGLYEAAPNPRKLGGVPGDNARRGKRSVSQEDSEEVVSLKNAFPPLGIFVAIAGFASLASLIVVIMVSKRRSPSTGDLRHVQVGQ